jgi:hypothetical protein
MIYFEQRQLGSYGSVADLQRPPQTQETALCDPRMEKARQQCATGNPMIASKLELSPCAVSVLGQLFVEGPTSGDNITSKAGRCDLVSAGLAFHETGLSSLTPDGVRLAREWDLCSLYARRDRRWYLKVRTNARPEGAAVNHSESAPRSGRIDHGERMPHDWRASG